jgi:hypothetical protein
LLPPPDMDPLVEDLSLEVLLLECDLLRFDFSW